MLTEEGRRRIADTAQAEASIHRMNVEVVAIEPVLDDQDGRTLMLYVTLSTGTVLAASMALPFGVGHTFPFRLN